MAVEECSGDFECPSTELCFVGVSWLPQNVSSLCACSTFYGWRGPTCESPGTQTLFLLVIASGILVAALMGFIYAIRAMRRLWEASPSMRALRKNPSCATLIYVFSSLLSVIAWRLSTIVVLTSPEKNDLALSVSDEKLHRGIVAENSFKALAMIFATLASLNVSLVWIHVARKSARMVRVEPNQWGNFDKAVYAFEILFVAVLIVGATRARTALAAALALPFLLIIAISYAWGLREMRQLLVLLGQSVEIQSVIDETPREGSYVSPPYSESLSMPASPEWADRESTNPRFEESGDGDGLAETPAQSRRSRVLQALQTPIRAASTRFRKPSLDKTSKKGREVRNRYMKLLTKITKTATLVMTSVMVLFVSAFVFAFLSLYFGEREICSPDNLCWPSILSEIISLFIVGLVATIEHYVYHNTKEEYMQYRRKSRLTGSSSASTPKVRVDVGFNHGQSPAPFVLDTETAESPAEPEHSL